MNLKTISTPIIKNNWPDIDLRAAILSDSMKTPIPPRKKSLWELFRDWVFYGVWDTHQRFEFKIIEHRPII